MRTVVDDGPLCCHLCAEPAYWAGGRVLWCVCGWVGALPRRLSTMFQGAPRRLRYRPLPSKVSITKEQAK